jgi:hypothetical protein
MNWHEGSTLEGSLKTQPQSPLFRFLTPYVLVVFCIIVVRFLLTFGRPRRQRIARGREDEQRFWRTHLFWQRLVRILAGHALELAPIACLTVMGLAAVACQGTVTNLRSCVSQSRREETDDLLLFRFVLSPRAVTQSTLGRTARGVRVRFVRARGVRVLSIQGMNQCSCSRAGGQNA